MILEEIGKSIKETREQRGWTRQILADKVDISRSLLSKLENGNRNLSEERINQILDCSAQRER